MSWMDMYESYQHEFDIQRDLQSGVMQMVKDWHLNFDGGSGAGEASPYATRQDASGAGRRRVVLDEDVLAERVSVSRDG